MARDIERRIRQLNTRRRGADRLTRVSKDAQSEILANSLTEETWQKRAPDQPYTRYALGAMQELGPEYTRISIETAERVGRQLKERLESGGRFVEFRLQGSVPLNVHIRGVSDVDLLNLESYYYSYYRLGPRALAGLYSASTSETSVDRLMRLRRECETILIAAYPAADVDISGGKAISISGGSLARPVDVVPSHWVDTIEYQKTLQEIDRGVEILDKNVRETIENTPFLHISRVHARDQMEADGGLKKAIRLCKNVKNDAIEDGKAVDLPSFDIAGVMYHANQSALSMGRIYELAILAETQRFLEALSNRPEFAKTLDVPDGSRKIFDTHQKLTGLKALSSEIDDLAREVAREQSNSLKHYDSLPMEDSRRVIAEAYIPT